MNKAKLRQLYKELEDLQDRKKIGEDISKMTDNVIDQEIASISASVKENSTIKILKKFSEEVALFKKNFNIDPIITSIRDLEQEIELDQKKSAKEFEAKLLDLKKSIPILPEPPVIPEPFNPSGLMSDIEKLRGEFLAKQDFDATPLQSELNNFRDQLQVIVANSTDSNEEIQKKIDELRKDLMNRLNEVGGGGNMNRKITVEGVNVLTKYTDINFYGTSASVVAAVDNTNKRVNIGIQGGGGASPLTTKGDLYTYSTTDDRLGVGADGTVLVADSIEPTGLKWTVPAGGGDVVKVGTPVDTQLGVWTGDGTIEGDAALTFDTTTDTLSTVDLTLSNDLLFPNANSIINFGGGDVTVTYTANTLTIAGGNLALGANSITMTGSLAATANRVTKGWFTDAESTNMYTVGGTSLTTVAQTFQNKTITNSNNVLGGVTMTLGSDADGDIYYRASNVLTRLPKGTAAQVLVMNAGATAPEWDDATGGGNVSNTGTPANNQIAIFTDATTIEGVAGLTFDGTTLTTTALVVDNLSLNGNTLTTTSLDLTIQSVDDIVIDPTNDLYLNAGTGDDVFIGDPGANMVFDGGLNNIGVGAVAAAGSVFEITAGAVQRPAVSAVGQFNIIVDTITFTNASSTVAIYGTEAIGIQTLANDNATLTLTDAASLYIAGAPAASTNVAITRPYSLWVDAGTSRFDGTTEFGSTITPFANDGAALGTGTLKFSDLFLASGGVINFNNGAVTITHSVPVGNELTIGGSGSVNVVLGTNSLFTTGSISSTGSRVTKLWATDIESTNMPTVGGTSLSSVTQTFTNKTIGAGALTLAENASIALDPVLSADGTYSGTTISGTAGATLAFGDVIYLAAADSRWELADADSVTTAGEVLIGMCVLAAAADGDPTVILIQGNIRADAVFPALTISAPVYISTTAGDVVVTQPSGTDDVAIVLGKALTADSFLFISPMNYTTHT